MPVARYVEQAFLLTKLDYRESDLVVTAFTPNLGRVAALARGARKSQRRFGGVLEPMHTLSLHLDEPSKGNLFILREASIQQARTKLITRLALLESAGKALSWIRHSVPERSAEPELFEGCAQLLDQLNHEQEEAQARLVLAEFGLFLLAALGVGLRLGECVVCGKRCAEGRPAFVDPKRGGLVCQSCGGASKRLAGDMRQRLQRASCGSSNVLNPGDADLAIELIELTLRAHMGF